MGRGSGKKQHSKDRLFITASEWKNDFGGKKDVRHQKFRQLPFDHCALSLQPFETPVATKEGFIFDILNIVPYLKEFHRNPVTGQELTAKDLFKLNFHKSNKNEYWCPVTFKVFTHHSHIVAIRKTGNVFAYEAVEELNLKAKNLEDLITGENFGKEDIVTLQDPHKLKVEVGSFWHVKQTEAAQQTGVDAEKAGGFSNKVAPSTSNDAATLRVMSNIASSSSSAAAEAAAIVSKKRKLAELSSSPSTASSSSSSFTSEPKKPMSKYTTGAVSRSFTSTGTSVATVNARAVLSDDDIREQRYAQLLRGKKKAYCRLNTSFGALNVELHTNLAPRTCHNFLLLAKQGKYNGTKFHRLIPGFMVQGGDPLGTGTGGVSAWGKPFKDEFHDSLLHSERGILSMANSGTNSNSSQFFVTFAECKHLNNKHSVFGRVVGGMEVLDRIEKVKVGEQKENPRNKDCPLTEIVLTDVAVFINPFDEEFVPDYERYEREREQKRVAEEKEKEEKSVRGQWFSAPQAQLDVKDISGGVGKYMPSSSSTSSSSTSTPSSSSAGLKLPVPSAHPALAGKGLLTSFSSVSAVPASSSTVPTASIGGVSGKAVNAAVAAAMFLSSSSATSYADDTVAKQKAAGGGKGNGTDGFGSFSGW